MWDGKKSKINKTVSCKIVYEKGGMNMLDVFGFLSAMKNIWLRKLSCGDVKKLPEFDSIKLYGSEYANVLMVR